VCHCVSTRSSLHTHFFLLRSSFPFFCFRMYHRLWLSWWSGSSTPWIEPRHPPQPPPPPAYLSPAGLSSAYAWHCHMHCRSHVLTTAPQGTVQGSPDCSILELRPPTSACAMPHTEYKSNPLSFYFPYPTAWGGLFSHTQHLTESPV
jgi:hypothetical protein